MAREPHGVEGRAEGQDRAAAEALGQQTAPQRSRGIRHRVR